jgi:flagellar motor switch protein FliM
MRVLIAEDDPALATFVRKGLEAEHYAVDIAADGEQARAMAIEFDYDLLTLDLILPRTDGIAILRHLRPRKPSLPILVLTAKSRVEDRVQCLDLGADDFLAKPFSFSELSARIRALLRRSHLPAASVLSVADLKIDRVERRVERAGKRIDLTSKEFGLLEYLMLNAGRRVTRVMIIEHVWNLSFDTSTNVIDVYVNYLRTAFQVGLVSAEHLTYLEFLSGVPERSYLGSCKLAPFGATALIQMDLAVAFPLIDVLLGGEGVGQPPSREITEIEEQILETIMRIICREMQTAWSPLALEFLFEQRQQAGRLQHLMPVEERTLGLSFEVSMKDCRGLMSFAVPAAVSSALIRKITAGHTRTHAHASSPASAEQIQRRLLRCPFRFELELQVAAPSAGELAALAPGKVLPLKRRADGMAQLVAGDRAIFQARASRLGKLRAAHVLAEVEEESPWGQQ